MLVKMVGLMVVKDSSIISCLVTITIRASRHFRPDTFAVSFIKINTNDLTPRHLLPGVVHDYPLHVVPETVAGLTTERAQGQDVGSGGVDRTHMEER